MKSKLMFTLCILSLMALAGVLYAGTAPEAQPAAAEAEQSPAPDSPVLDPAQGAKDKICAGNPEVVCAQTCADHGCSSEGVCTAEGCLCTCPFN